MNKQTQVISKNNEDHCWPINNGSAMGLFTYLQCQKYKIKKCYNLQAVSKKMSIKFIFYLGRGVFRGKEYSKNFERKEIVGCLHLTAKFWENRQSSVSSLSVFCQSFGGPLSVLFWLSVCLLSMFCWSSNILLLDSCWSSVGCLLVFFWYSVGRLLVSCWSSVSLLLVFCCCCCTCWYSRF